MTLNTNSLILDPAILNEIKVILARIAPSVEVWAFGSRVKGFSHACSDLDLVIRNPTELDKSSGLVIALKAAFQESNCPILIDVMDWALLSLPYREEIEKAYVVIQKP